MESINVNTLNQWITAKKPQLLLDIREEWEFNHCSIDGSINIPMSLISERLEELGEDNNIIVICHHGARSLQVAYYLEDSGIKNKIMNLEGGIDAWADQVENQMPRY
ncbi:MAG: rhodanese-related sulfurtransferase [Gammaproteobacteria bacterium]|jgi:rhodanese-related sulfurtransferase